MYDLDAVTDAYAVLKIQFEMHKAVDICLSKTARFYFLKHG